MSAKNSQTISYKIDSTPQIDKKQLRSPLEIFLPFLGCHQEFLLDNLRRGRSFGLEAEFARLKLTEEEKQARLEKIKTYYEYDLIYEKHQKAISERDAVIEKWKAQEGKVYVINFKPAGEYLAPKPRGESYSAGLIYLYPEGIEELKIQDVLFRSEKILVEKNQLYYIRWVDTVSKPKKKGYTLSYEKKEGDTIYANAEFKTRGFTLFAPKIEVREGKKRVKIIIRSKLKESSE